MAVTQETVNNLVENAMVTAEEGIVRPQSWTESQKDTGQTNLGVDADSYPTTPEVEQMIDDAINAIRIGDNIPY